MTNRTEEKENQLILHLKGDLNIERSEALKNVLMEAVTQPKNVVIDLAEASEVSLSTLQLLCSAHRSALMKNKRLSLNSRPTIFRDTVRIAGYRRHHGCKHDRNNSCLWLEDNSNE